MLAFLRHAAGSAPRRLVFDNPAQPSRACHCPVTPLAVQISPGKNANYRCTSAALTHRSHCGLGHRAEAAISRQIRARQQAQVQQALQALDLRALASQAQQRQAWRAGEMAPWQGRNLDRRQAWRSKACRPARRCLDWPGKRRCAEPKRAVVDGPIQLPLAKWPRNAKQGQFGSPGAVAAGDIRPPMPCAISPDARRAQGKKPVSPPSNGNLPAADLVGANGLEPSTPTMSRWCSNQLSYAPAKLSTIAGCACR